ncbi:hypothetical protein LTR86_009087 [Recurvomyces mirabilis]|nr:hypothetical protein LTR86_009087 [Recurvomyces mirabilis]
MATNYTLTIDSDERQMTANNISIIFGTIGTFLAVAAIVVGVHQYRLGIGIGVMRQRQGDDVEQQTQNSSKEHWVFAARKNDYFDCQLAGTIILRERKALKHDPGPSVSGMECFKFCMPVALCRLCTIYFRYPVAACEAIGWVIWIGYRGYCILLFAQAFSPPPCIQDAPNVATPACINSNFISHQLVTSSCQSHYVGLHGDYRHPTHADLEFDIPDALVEVISDSPELVQPRTLLGHGISEFLYTRLECSELMIMSRHGCCGCHDWWTDIKRYGTLAQEVEKMAG